MVKKISKEEAELDHALFGVTAVLVEGSGDVSYVSVRDIYLKQDETDSVKKTKALWDDLSTAINKG